LFWVISSTTRDLHLAANRDNETFIAIAARLAPKMTTKFVMFMVNKCIYNLPFKVSMHKENEEVVGIVKVIGNGA
jgi:glycyl-tRNA synthetase beta subunit